MGEPRFRPQAQVISRVLSMALARPEPKRAAAEHPLANPAAMDAGQGRHPTWLILAMPT